MKRTFKKRRGKILVMLAILLPALCGVAGLTIDMGLLTSTSEQIQHAADAAATAAAFELRRGRNLAAATSTAIDCVHSDDSVDLHACSLGIAVANCDRQGGGWIRAKHRQ
jgi:Flp pilus assembly protein TadG